MEPSNQKPLKQLIRYRHALIAGCVSGILLLIGWFFSTLQTRQDKTASVRLFGDTCTDENASVTPAASANQNTHLFLNCGGFLE